MSQARRAMKFLRTACAVSLGATVMATAACGVEVGAAYPDGYYGDYPPDAYIATTEPFYFEGRATYWYGGRWYYRDGGRWGHYEREPPALYQRRWQAAPARRTYEAPRGRPAGRSTTPSRGRGRSDGHR